MTKHQYLFFFFDPFVFAAKLSMTVLDEQFSSIAFCLLYILLPVVAISLLD